VRAFTLEVRLTRPRLAGGGWRPESALVAYADEVIARKWLARRVIRVPSRGSRVAPVARRRRRGLILGSGAQQDASDGDDYRAERGHYPRPAASEAQIRQHRTVRGREIYVVDHEGRLGVGTPRSAWAAGRRCSRL